MSNIQWSEEIKRAKEMLKRPDQCGAAFIDLAEQIYWDLSEELIKANNDCISWRHYFVDVLQEFGTHKSMCLWQPGRDSQCNCGFKKAIKSLKPVEQKS